MGLDQYAYVAMKRKEREAFYEQDLQYDPVTHDWIVPEGGVQKPRELAYWRKHPNLQGWMEKLYRAKGGTEDFNGIELELTWEEIDMLEKDIKNGYMAKMKTTGFFFGRESDDYYEKQDLQFCIDAKAECFLGRKVFYNSSW